MTICERLFKTIEEKKLKTADLAKVLNIKQSVLSNWKKRNTNPPIEYTVVICEFLGISIEYLLTGKEQEQLTPEDKQLLKAYNQADIGTRNSVRKLLDIPAEPGKSLTSRTG